MKYSYEFKLECVKNYKEGKQNIKPDGVTIKNFRDKVRLWVRSFDLYGPDGLKHKQFNKDWTKEERYELVAKVLAGQPNKSVAIEAGINDGQLYQWVQKYKQHGLDGLELKHKGRPPKGGYIMTKSKKDKPTKLTQSEKEELILLREKEKYLEAENAYLKKLAALTVKKKAESSAKAKKQPSSKDS